MKALLSEQSSDRLVQTIQIQHELMASLIQDVDGLKGDLERLPELVEELKLFKLVLAVILRGDVIIRQKGAPVYISEPAAKALHRDFQISMCTRGGGIEVAYVVPKIGRACGK